MSTSTPPSPADDPLDAEALSQRIRQFLAKQILFSGDSFPHPDDASLLQTGVIDSLGVMDLVGFVQQQFGIEVGATEITPENFDSVARLVAYVQSKRRARTVPATA